MKTKFGEWTVRLRTQPSPPVVIPSIKGKDRRKVSIDNFHDFGMMKFPTELHKMIQNDLKYANQYDKFLDKFYEWYDTEY